VRREYQRHVLGVVTEGASPRTHHVQRRKVGVMHEQVDCL
jgi:hypothetical protein